MTIHKTTIDDRKNPMSKPLVLVIKVGTSSICDEKTKYPLLSNLSRIVETILKLKSLGHRVVLVTSAAVGTGLRRLNLSKKPQTLSGIQAIAAVGQGRLMSMYDDLFGRFNQPIAQILLTRNDLADRSQYLNAVNCLEELLDMDVIPIVNENDTISTVEIKFGDNDTLSAITSGMVRADYLFLMTDVDCLYTDNPRINPNAQPVLVCDNIKKLRQQISVSSTGSSLGTGGMVTKLIAADLATAAGVTTIIARGAVPENIIPMIMNNEKVPLHTRFTPKPRPLIDRKWWILHGLHTSGAIEIGNEQIFCRKKLTASTQEEEDDANTVLLVNAVKSIEGNFVKHQAVNVITRKKDDNGVTISIITVAKGIVNFSSAEIDRILQASKNDMLSSSEYNNINTCIMSSENIAIYT